jgi:AMP-polyphosphate phosphotransferase
VFDAAGTGHTLGKAAFERRRRALQAGLLAAQAALREAGVPVVIVIAGVETAGRGQVVKRLNEWLDARSVQSFAFWDETDEERERPWQWRFWRALPPAGTIAILFGSWYTRPIVARARKRIGKGRFQRELEAIAALERTLADNGTLLVKLWFHVTRKQQKRELRRIVDEQRRQLTPYEKTYRKLYDRILKASATALEATDRAAAPWHVIDAGDRFYREYTAGRLLLEAMKGRLRRRGARTSPPLVPGPREFPAVLDRIDLSARVGRAAYERTLAREQARLNRLTWAAKEAKVSTVAVFEGWDAAGKGGAIRRVVAGIDARLFHVIPVSAPTDEERAHHYLWRFWRHVPRGGYVTIYDRSWYGRVLVERVEGLAQPHEWRRAYGEINEFERQLTGHGACLLKFWLHISPEEQLRRFRKRARLAHKQHKLGDEDWRNRRKRQAYADAVEEMLARTRTAHGPWTLVAAKDKRHARLVVVKAVGDALEEALGR